jgi:pimeloyl-ACP methyl ester carboxylesterase
LCGHSFGGYIAGNYALKYEKYIRKLMLLSPIGIRPGEESEIDCNFSEADIEKKFKGM